MIRHEEDEVNILDDESEESEGTDVDEFVNLEMITIHNSQLFRKNDKFESFIRGDDDDDWIFQE